MEEPKVVIKDQDKLYTIGFQDGFERAMKILQNNPENLEYLNVVTLPVYHEAYLAGIEEAKKQMGYVQEDTPIKK